MNSRRKEFNELCPKRQKHYVNLECEKILQELTSKGNLFNQNDFSTSSEKDNEVIERIEVEDPC